MFKPYSKELKGDLEAYLKERFRGQADNMFYGSEHFFEIKDLGLIRPGISYVRVNMSPIPDTGYMINENYLLESTGQGNFNMSLMGAKEGVYDPKVALKDQIWSISGLDFYSKERKK